MEVLIINQHEVAQLLPMGEAITAMREALIALAQGDAIQPLRPVMWLPEKVGALGMMPGYLGPVNAMGIKVVSVFPGNHGTEYDSHQGSVMLFETTHGRLLSLMDATEITAIRTAAVSAVSTDALANPEASKLAILGSGTQAQSHIEAMLAIRPITHINIWSRNPDAAAALAERAAKKYNITIYTTPTVAEAVAGAHIICTTTASPEPIFTSDMLEAGMHINAVGSSVPFAREIDSATMGQANVFVDRRESTVNESGDYIFAAKDGVIGEGDLSEVGDVLIGVEGIGRKSPTDITLFDSLGLAIEDIASAHHIYTRALAEGVGTMVELGGGRLTD